MFGLEDDHLARGIMGNGDHPLRLPLIRRGADTDAVGH